MKITLPTISFLFIVSLSLFSFASQAQTNVVPDDVEFQALKDIFDNLGGATWTTKTNWPVAGSWPTTATSAQFKTWYGITVTNGDVTAIIFNNNNNLQGIIPSSIANLTALQNITINNNTLLTSPIPASIGSLTNLTILSLSADKLTGQIPSSLASLVNLTSLYITFSSITGDIPDLSPLTKLVMLNLSGNSFTAGAIPSWILTMTTLGALNMQATQRTGPIPDGIGNLSNLTSLILGSNQLTGPIPSSIGNLTKLTSLQLFGNQLSGDIPSTIGNLTSLSVCTLQNNLLTSIPSTIGNLTNVTMLYIFNNKLASSIPPEIGNMIKLTDLEIHANQLTGPIPSTLGNLSNLATLNLSGNQLAGSIPSSLGGLSKMITLSLGVNKLTGSIPTELGNLTNLTGLALNSNQLSGSIPVSLGNLTKLTALYLYSNQLTGPIPDSFGNLTNLTGLYLYLNQLSGSLPSSLGNLNKLVYLSLYNNQLTGPLPASLSGLSQLTYLYLYYNKFTGSFPAFNWPKINMIQIQYNYFTGVFPDVTNMPNLAYLSAANNLFTGIDNSILNKSLITYIHFINNELISTPDFSQHVNKANLAVYVQSNRLDFSKLEPLLTAGLKTVGTPLTQKNIHDITYVTPAVGSPLVIQARPRGSQSSAFTWEKQVNGTWVDVNSNAGTQNQDASQYKDTYTRSSFALADEGTYHWKETSTATGLAGVTIQSDPIQVKVPVRVAMDNWTFQYKYDGRKRMIQKKVPGADWVYMVYDNRDRLVMTQDGNQRLLNQWTFTKYDALNRPVMTGIYTHASGVDQAGMQTIVNNYYSALTASQAWYDSYIGGGATNVHGYDNKSFPQITDNNFCTSVIYYDNYSFKSLFPTGYDYTPDGLAQQVENGVTYSQRTTEFANVTGLVTGTRTKQLQGVNAYGAGWLNGVTYYDDKYRTIQTINDNAQGGKDRVSNVVDFTGKVLESKTTHNTSSLQWKDVVYASVNTTNLVDISGSDGVPAGAASVQTLPANTDGWVEVTVSELNTQRDIGLSAANTGQSFSTIDFDIKLNGGSFRIYEGGVYKNITITMAGGDVLRIGRIGTTITYYKNGTAVYTSATPSSSSLLIDASLTTRGGALTNIRSSFVPITPDVSVTRRFEYDHAGRLMNTWHQTGTNPEVLLTQNQYNELGQLVDKKLYSTDNASTFKQSEDYRYNIRGWLTSINNSQLTNDGVTNDDTNDLFGMNLSYNDVVSGITTTPQYNGNISAMKWSKDLAQGTIKDQAYAYTYDPMNRIASSAYLTNNGTWAASTAFAENGFCYDQNGNIKKLTRTDTNGGSMDILSYDYGSGNTQSNQLLSVTDTGDPANGFAEGNLASTDYTYDPTGSMTVDNNKGITAITYNYLHLPQQVTKSTGDYIKYIYDATGRKLSQQVYNSANVIQKKTDYAGEFYYENDVLQFINHEEGRVVMTGSAPEYQYHLKDHLGNVRTTFTTKVDVDSETATLEAANAPTEQNEFLRYDDVRRINATIFDHTHHVQAPAADGTAYSERLNGTPNEIRGLEKSLSVMAGDKIHMEVYAKYFDPTHVDQGVSGNNLLSTLYNISQAAAGYVIDGANYAISGSQVFPLLGMIDYTNGDPDAALHAHLNWVVVDRNYKQVDGGYVPLTGGATGREDGTDVAFDYLSSDITITEPGYVYVYLSNDNVAMGKPPVDVYFDDFNVKVTKSPVIQTDDYYPFGLTFNSYQRENSLINKWKFQGQEHVSDLGVNWDSFKWRNHQPDLGRFFGVDPLADKYVYNSPYAFAENKLGMGIELEGLELFPLSSSILLENPAIVRPVIENVVETSGGKPQWNPNLSPGENLSNMSRIGRAAHVERQEIWEAEEGYSTETQMGKENRLDGYKVEQGADGVKRGFIRELKPNSTSGKKNGYNQLKRYVDKAMKENPDVQEWQPELELYKGLVPFTSGESQNENSNNKSSSQKNSNNNFFEVKSDKTKVAPKMVTPTPCQMSPDCI